MRASRKIAIIGGGTTGLLCALALKKLEFQLGTRVLDIKVYQDDPMYYSEPKNFTSWIIWPWTRKVLEKYLGAHVFELISCKLDLGNIIDVDSKFVLGKYPTYGRQEWKNKIECYANDEWVYNIYSIRPVDLLKALLACLKYGVLNDSDEQHHKILDEIKSGMENPFNTNWFEEHMYAHEVETLELGYELSTYRMSATTGEMTLVFKNGKTIDVDMLIGADGKDSVVRKLLDGDR